MPVGLHPFQSAQQPSLRLRIRHHRDPVIEALKGKPFEQMRVDPLLSLAADRVLSASRNNTATTSSPLWSASSWLNRPRARALRKKYAVSCLRFLPAREGGLSPLATSETLGFETKRMKPKGKNEYPREQSAIWSTRHASRPGLELGAGAIIGCDAPTHIRHALATNADEHRFRGLGLHRQYLFVQMA